METIKPPESRCPGQPEDPNETKRQIAEAVGAWKMRLHNIANVENSQKRDRE